MPHTHIAEAYPVAANSIADLADALEAQQASLAADHDNWLSAFLLTIILRPRRDANWYAEEAERLRQKAVVNKDYGPLRYSYPALAREYEELTVTLEKRHGSARFQG